MNMEAHRPGMRILGAAAGVQSREQLDFMPWRCAAKRISVYPPLIEVGVFFD